MGAKQLKSEKYGGLVIDRPGFVLAIPYLDNGQIDWANQKRNSAKVMTCTITNTRTKTDIGNGNSFHKAGDRVTAMTGSLAIEFSTIDPVFWGMASGTGKLEEKTDDNMLMLYEPVTIDETTNKVEFPYERATVSGKPGNLKVVDNDGTEFEEDSASGTSVTAGKYRVTSSDGKTTLTFNASDAGKTVVVTEEVKMNTVSYSIGVETMPVHRFIIQTTVSDVDNTVQIPTNYIISRATISADTTDTLQRDPSVTKTLTFDILAPRAGEKPYTVKYANLAE